MAICLSKTFIFSLKSFEFALLSWFLSWNMENPISVLVAFSALFILNKSSLPQIYHLIISIDNFLKFVYFFSFTIKLKSAEGDLGFVFAEKDVEMGTGGLYTIVVWVCIINNFIKIIYNFTYADFLLPQSLYPSLLCILPHCMLLQHLPRPHRSCGFQEKPALCSYVLKLTYHAFSINCQTVAF